MNSVVIRDQETIRLQNKLSLDKNLNSVKGSRQGCAGNKLELCVLTQLHHVPWICLHHPPTAVINKRGDLCKFVKRIIAKCERWHFGELIDKGQKAKSASKSPWSKEKKEVCWPHPPALPVLATHSPEKPDLKPCSEWTSSPWGLPKLKRPQRQQAPRVTEVGAQFSRTSRILLPCIGARFKHFNLRKHFFRWNCAELGLYLKYSLIYKLHFYYYLF